VVKTFQIWAFFYQNFYLSIFAVVKILEGTLMTMFAPSLIHTFYYTSKPETANCIFVCRYVRC